MKVSLIGYGAMGKTVEQCLENSGVELFSKVDPMNPEADFREIDENSIGGCDVCICFTTPDSAMRCIEKISGQKKNIVMATTGWTNEMEKAKKLIDLNGVGMVYSSNFSLGVNLFFNLLKHASSLINHFDDYDVLGYELHHKRKKDSPSGTAKTMEKILLNNFTRKKKAQEDRLNRPVEEEEFHFASVRGGDIPGTHVVQFESVFDSIELKHTARNRIGFAKGAILAAKWIAGKKGLYRESDVMENFLNR